MDFYTHHLAEVNKTREVIATDDIRNAQGQLVLPKGQIIDGSAADRIVKFKLLKPIEGSIAIENEIDSASLEKSILDYISADPSLNEAHRAYQWDGQLARCCRAACAQPIMRQKLTVLCMLLPKTFYQGLFCAWLSLLYSRETNANDIVTSQLFIVALIHDIGQLHCSRSIFIKTGKLEPEELRQLHAHPIIGEKILAGMGAPKKLSRAILEHHETLDGSGFPAGKISVEISDWGSLLFAFDNAYAIYHKNFKPNGKSFADILPIMQINARAKYGDSARSLFVVIKRVKATTSISFPEDKIEQLVTHIKARHAYLVSFCDIAEILVKECGFTHKNKKLHALQNAYFGLHVSMAESGLINDAYMRWLDQMAEQKITSAYREAEDALLMLNELCYLVSRIRGQVHLFLMDNKDGDMQATLAPMLEKLAQCVEPKAMTLS